MDSFEIGVVLQSITLVLVAIMWHRQKSETQFYRSILHGLMDGELKIVRTKTRVGVVPRDVHIDEVDKQ